MDHVNSANIIWFYTQLGIQAGPVAANGLAAMARSGQLLRADLVWKEGMTNWVEAGTAGELFPTFTPVPPPLVAAQAVEPLRVATQAGAAPIGDAIWCCEKGGSRVGPVPEVEMATLLIAKTLMPTSQVWRKGFAN